MANAGENLSVEFDSQASQQNQTEVLPDKTTLKRKAALSEQRKQTWNLYLCMYLATSRGRRGGLMVSALDSGASGPGSGPGRGHCVVFLGKTLCSHSASLHPGV